MAYDDLREWIKTLEKNGELKRIRERCRPSSRSRRSPTACRRSGRTVVRASRSPKDPASIAPGGPALLFENVKGHPGHKVLINQFGSERRMAMALGVEQARRDRGTYLRPDEHEGSRRAASSTSSRCCRSSRELGERFSEDGEREGCALQGSDPARRIRPARLSDPEVLAARWRSLHHAALCPYARTPERASATSACIACRSTTARRPACTGSGRRWRPSTIARRCARRAAEQSTEDPKAAGVAAMAESAGGAVTVPDGPIGGLPQVAFGNLKGSRMEVAVAIGTDPATTFSAIVPAPPEVEEFMIAGFLRGKPVEIVKCETVDLEVPAHAEIILEGYVELGELRSEGPLRRSHRLLHHDRRVSGLSPHLHHASQRPDLRRDDRRQAADGRRLDGQGRRAHLSSRDEDDDSGDRRHASAGRRRLPQPDAGLDQEELSGPGAQGDERHLVAGPGHVHQVHHRGRRRLRRAGRGRGGAARHQ